MDRRPDQARPAGDALDQPRDAVDQPGDAVESEADPSTGGIFRRLSAGTSGFGGSFGVVEQVFAPSLQQAREDLQEQHRIGRPAPAPTDPPDLGPERAGAADPASRFRGRIVIRRPGPAGRTGRPDS